VAFPLGVLHQDPGVLTLVADGLWNRHLRNSHDLESLMGRYVVDTSNHVVVDQRIHDSRNAEGGGLVAT